MKHAMNTANVRSLVAVNLAECTNFHKFLKMADGQKSPLNPIQRSATNV